MVTNTKNTIKPSTEKIQSGNDDWKVRFKKKQALEQLKIDNAQKLVEKYGYYGGKRFLGINKNGTEVWIKFKCYEDTIEIMVTNGDLFACEPQYNIEEDADGFETKVNVGGEYANDRYQYFYTDSNYRTHDTYDPATLKQTETSKKARNGRVTYTTLLSLQGIIDECEKFTFQGKKPPRSVYRELAWLVLPNTWNAGPSYPQTSWDYTADLQKYKDPVGYYWWNNI